MKTTTVLKFIVLVLLSNIVWAQPEIDQPAPTFNLVNSYGKEISLADYAGKTVVLEWTNHLCPYVKKHYRSQNMQKLQKKFTSKGVVWLSIISSAPGKQGYVSADKANNLSEKRNAVPTHVLFDPTGKVGRLYNAKTTPHMYIVDAEGVLRYMGGIDSIGSSDIDDIERADNYVELGLTQLLGGEKIQHTKTRPYGCSVKYAAI